MKESLDKMLSIYKHLLKEESSSLEYIDNDKITKLSIHFNLDKTDFFSENNDKTICIVNDKSLNHYYVTYQNLIDLISESKYNETKNDFFSCYYLRHNKENLTKVLKDEIYTIHEEYNHTKKHPGQYNVNPPGQYQFQHEMCDDNGAEQMHNAMRDYEMRIAEERNRRYLHDRYSINHIDHASLINTDHDHTTIDPDSLDRLRRMFSSL